MRIAIRADASAAVGSGHVMRCGSLADALRENGHAIDFVSRGLPVHLADDLRRRGHGLLALASGPVTEAEDAAESLRRAGTPDWWVIDHYALGQPWEDAVRRGSVRLLAIDDIGRPHDTDLLLDQNLQGTPDDRYADRVPPHCTRLLGPRYALLRAEFAQARSTVAPRDGRVRRLLVFLGGMDADNVTERVLLAVRAARLPDIGVDIVVGAGHPALERLQALACKLPNARCHVQTTRMVDLMAQADLAVGAGGTATWERCALGVPTLALCIADNQRDLLDASSRAGIVYVPDSSDQGNPATLGCICARSSATPPCAAGCRAMLTSASTATARAAWRPRCTPADRHAARRCHGLRRAARLAQRPARARCLAQHRRDRPRRPPALVRPGADRRINACWSANRPANRSASFASNRRRRRRGVDLPSAAGDGPGPWRAACWRPRTGCAASSRR